MFHTKYLNLITRKCYNKNIKFLNKNIEFVLPAGNSIRCHNLTKKNANPIENNISCAKKGNKMSHKIN